MGVVDLRRNRSSRGRSESRRGKERESCGWGYCEGIEGFDGGGRNGSSMGRRRGKGQLGQGEVFEGQGRGESPSLLV
jgi:hypothetical protein